MKEDKIHKGRTLFEISKTDHNGKGPTLAAEHLGQCCRSVSLGGVFLRWEGLLCHGGDPAVTPCILWQMVGGCCCCPSLVEYPGPEEVWCARRVLPSPCPAREAPGAVSRLCNLLLSPLSSGVCSPGLGGVLGVRPAASALEGL